MSRFFRSTKRSYFRKWGKPDLRLSDAIQFAQVAGLERLDAELLLAHASAQTRTYLYAYPETELSADQSAVFEKLVQRRRTGEPIAYLTGQREFWSLPLSVSSATLIPRPDTEVLVELVLDMFDHSPLHCLDLGTGSGAIALAIKSERTAWKVWGIDRVSEAVSLAKKNAGQLNLDVEFSSGDWLADVPQRSQDIIVSNPPYIDALDAHLQEGDVRFEPRSALVAEQGGLADIKNITQQSLSVMKPDGWLFFEHGWQQGSAVRDILGNAGFERIRTVQDYGGRDRVTFGKLGAR